MVTPQVFQAWRDRGKVMRGTFKYNCLVSARFVLRKLLLMEMPLGWILRLQVAHSLHAIYIL